MPKGRDYLLCVRLRFMSWGIPEMICDPNSCGIRELADHWCDARCNTAPEGYSCPPDVHASCELTGKADREYRPFLFGPEGWSGGPPEHDPGSEFNFVGVRCDLLLNSRSRDKARRVLAHEMAHERQRFCGPDYNRLSRLSILTIERQAEIEVLRYSREHLKRSPGPCSHAAALLRPSLHMILDRLPNELLMATVAIVLLLFLALPLLGGLQAGSFLATLPLPSLVFLQWSGVSLVTFSMMVVVYRIADGVYLTKLYIQNDVL